MALKDYLPGIMGSIENISRNLVMAEKLDMESEKLTFDYAISKAKIEAEQERYKTEVGFKKRAETREEKQLEIAKERADAYDKYMKELGLTAGLQRQLTEKNLAKFEERYQDEKALKKLQMDVQQGIISTNQFELELKKLKKKQLEDQEKYSSAMLKLQAEAQKLQSDANKKSAERYKQFYQKEIRGLDKKTIGKTLMSPFREVGVGLTAAFSDETKEDVRRRWAKENKMDYILNKMPFIIKYEEETKAYDKMSRIFDNIAGSYDGTLPLIKEQIIGAYPTLDAPTEYPDFMKKMLEESLYDYLPRSSGASSDY